MCTNCLSKEKNVCVELKRLNQVVKCKLYKLPNLDDIAPKLNWTIIFSHQGTTGGFQQILLKNHNCQLTILLTLMGCHCYGLGMTLYKEVEKERKPIVFVLCTLHTAKWNYALIDEECLTAVCASEKFDRPPPKKTNRIKLLCFYG